MDHVVPWTCREPRRPINGPWFLNARPTHNNGNGGLAPLKQCGTFTEENGHSKHGTRRGIPRVGTHVRGTHAHIWARQPGTRCVKFAGPKGPVQKKWTTGWELRDLCHLEVNTWEWVLRRIERPACNQHCIRILRTRRGTCAQRNRTNFI